ncbi:MAG: macro domain-containing protein [Firmicutes bacterium]|nr:macro domain-containing protein [Bacillota bacterium]
MPFIVLRNDITKMKVDVIVNSANPEPMIGGGVDFAIHEAGGKELVEARINLGAINIGEVKETKGYNLPSNHVFHVVGPVYKNGNENESGQLYSCYMNALLLARDMKVESIAFPLISAGIFGFPRDKAITIATRAIKDFLEKHEIMIYLVVFDTKSYIISKEIHEHIESLIDSGEVDLQEKRANEMGMRQRRRQMESAEIVHFHAREFDIKEDTWQEALFQYIDAKGLKETDVYKKANIDRKHFSKIRSNSLYHPSKPTAVAFAIALNLEIDDTIDFVGKAGYHLSQAIRFDVIIRYYIEQKNYDIFLINNTLFDFDQELLGA